MHLTTNDVVGAIESFIAFARRFGLIDLHVLDRYWMPGHPEIGAVG